jgi:S1-C subfamily serine protease
MGGGGRGTQSDSDGRFKLEHVSAGQTSVVCFDPSGRASGTTTVEAGGTAHVDIVLKAGAAAFTRSYAGLQFETRLSDIVVKQVETGSPGETAGVKVGDVLEKIGERAVDGRWGGENVQRMLEGRPAGTAVKLTIERDDKEQTVEVKLEAPR